MSKAGLTCLSIWIFLAHLAIAKFETFALFLGIGGEGQILLATLWLSLFGMGLIHLIVNWRNLDELFNHAQIKYRTYELENINKKLTAAKNELTLIQKELSEVKNSHPKTMPDWR